MCQEQVHLNNHILTALAQHVYFHNTSNKNELVRITRHEKSLHIAFDTQSLCEISFLQAIHHKTGVRQYIRHLCLWNNLHNFCIIFKLHTTVSPKKQSLDRMLELTRMLLCTEMCYSSWRKTTVPWQRGTLCLTAATALTQASLLWHGRWRCQLMQQCKHVVQFWINSVYLSTIYRTVLNTKQPSVFI